MKIGVIFCGGCNPRYERGSVVERLRGDFPEAEIGRAGDGSADLLAVVCGCHVACASHEALQGEWGKIVLTQETDYEALRAALLSKRARDGAGFGQ